MAIDVSSSMLAQDLKPNRLAALKRVASEFIDDRLSDRIGLVVYAGESYTKTPITNDKSIVKLALEGINYENLIEDGTAIGMGLATSVNRLKDSKANFFTMYTHTGVMVWKFFNALKSDLSPENIDSYYKKLYQDDFDGLKIAIKELKRLNSHCEDKEINCVIVLIPDIHKLNPYKLEFINNKMSNFSKSINLKYFDLLDIFQSEDEKKVWNKYNDPHPNQYAHNLIATDIFKKLNK